MRTFEEKISFLKTCETGYVNDALNLLKIGNCWIDGIQRLGNQSGSMVGRVYTAQFRQVQEGKNLKTMYHCVDCCPAGDVLMVAGFPESQLVGENLLTRASNKGLAGVVIDTKNRDVDGICNLPMPVFSRGRAVRFEILPLKIDFELEAHIWFGDAEVSTGDVVVGDSDGVIIIPKERLDEVIYQLEMIKEVEDAAVKANRENPDLPVEEYLKIVGRKKKPRE